MSGSTVHARLAVEPSDCPVADLATDLSVRRFVPPGGDAPPQVLVEDAATDALAAREDVDPVLSVGEFVVCRVPALAGDPCGHDHCLARGLEFLPVPPYHVRWRGERVHLSLAAADPREVRGVTGRLRQAGFAVEVEQITHDGGAASAERAVVSLDALTDRQREVVRHALERGYFDPDGPSAGALAAELDIAKPTLSEHLRAVQTEIIEQIFD